jgi:glycoside/pentoside/hexuronide:cation symporter, GPH family
VSSAVLASRPDADTPPLANAWAGLRYGALGFPLAFLALPLYVVLPSHYAAQYGVPLATLGIVLLVTRALDAALDPFIGQAVDGVFVRSARRAWWVALSAAICVGVGFTALFFPQVDAPALPALLAWLAAGLLLTYIAFSVLSVIHQAWGTRLGGDPKQRARVVAWREGCGLFGVLAASVLPSQLGMGAASLVLAVALAIGVALLAGAPSAPPRLHARPQAAGSRHPRATAHWALPWHSAAFRRLLAVFMLNGIASAVPATLVLFFVRDRLQAGHAEALFLGAYFAAAVVSIPLWVRIVRSFGLARAWLGGMGLAVAAFAWVLTLGAGDSAGFLAVCIASGVALGADLTIPGALLTGVVQRAGHAALAEGVYVGWWNSATKLNLGLAAGTALPLLALAGYAPGQRDAQALQVLSLAYVAVPCVLKLTAALLLWRGWINTKAEE